jgi:hypothetical protein
MVNVVSIFSRARDWRHNPDRNLNSRRFFFFKQANSFLFFKSGPFKIRIESI